MRSNAVGVGDHWTANSANGGDFVGELLEVLPTLLHGVSVCADGAIRGFKEEHRFARFHCHRHEAAVVLELGEAIRIGVHLNLGAVGFIKHRDTVFARDAPHPAVESLDRMAVLGEVLHEDIAGWIHGAPWKTQVRCRVFGEPFIPLRSPASQRGAEFTQSLHGKEIGGERNDDVIGGNEDGPVDGAEVWADRKSVV